MESRNSNEAGSTRMAFVIDLNEAPIASPREAANDTVLGVLVCALCRKVIPGVRRAEAEERRDEFKCFRCLLKNDGGGASSSGGGGSGFDINASPPRDAEGGDDVAGRNSGAGGGGKVQVTGHSPFSSNQATRRQVNPLLVDIKHNLRKTSSVRTVIANSGFKYMSQQKVHSGGNLGSALKECMLSDGTRSSHSTPSKLPPQSPSMLYLQSLREYIAERSGVLGEGWNVAFEFCEFKTSAIYIAPNGSKHKTMEGVAGYLGLPSLEEENGSKRFSVNRNAIVIDKSAKELGFPENGSSRDSMHLPVEKQLFERPNMPKPPILTRTGPIFYSLRDGLPIQFQDFCLISAGNVDPRPTYHNSNQIWPVGYRCTWHDRVTGSLFVCDVADGGDFGPIFKVQRYPCTTHSVPGGLTILLKTNPVSCKEDDKVGKDDLATFKVVDDDSISTITLLNEDSPPCLETCLSASKKDNGIHNLQENNSSKPDSKGEIVGLSDIVGEFHVEGRSTSSVCEMASQAFLYACHETYKQNGAIKFYCSHDVQGMNAQNLDATDPLSRYCYFDGLINIPPLVQREKEFNMAYETLRTWLNQDRFALHEDFVQEIIERLPGITACSEYINLNDRRNASDQQTVGSGFFQVDQKMKCAYGTLNKSQLKLIERRDILKPDPCPPGKPISSTLPSYLVGDALQVSELAWRFSEVLGFGQPFSFQELESELVSPWSDGYVLNSGHEPDVAGDFAHSTTEKDSLGRAARLGRTTGLLSKIFGSLLRLLVSELLSKVAVYVCPNPDAGESKSRRRKKVLDCLAALKKTKLHLLPVNELSWHEIARRYILAVLSMEGNLDSTEIASREGGKVFHCLRGDGGILCGSLTGIAALEGDAVVLADAMKEIYGSLKSNNEIITVCDGECDVNGSQTVEVKDDVTPEWAQALEPIRKLPTNVGARIRRCVNEALGKNPPEWAKKILEHSISKEVYKGNASGPTKRAVISVLANLSSENPQEKTEKKDKVKIKTNTAHLITKQCQIVLRRAAAADEDRVFCNLLGRVILNRNDNDDEGLLGYPAMVPRPIDLRTIDLRLATGVYGGSHEAFIDDVREVWRNIRTAYGDRSDLINVAESLSQKFEDMYEKEVLTLVHKIAEISSANDSSADAIKERDDLLAQLTKTSVPRAPWDEGLCKVCGMDKDDDNVLLCDRCDSEYHRYCLNPPLLRIPDGNWYCPSCVSGQSFHYSAAYGTIASQRRKRLQGNFTCKFLEDLSQLANLLEIKECWEFTVEERIFFMKFLFDEALNSATIREHLDQCSSRAADLQQKLKSLNSELKVLKFREETFGLSAEKANSGVSNVRGDLKSDASSSLLSAENSSKGKQSDEGTNLAPFSGLTNLEDGTNLNEQVDCSKQLVTDHSQQESIFPHAPLSKNDNLSHDMLSSQDNSLKVGSIKNDISNMEDSISSVELELHKVSLRKDYLGRDSNGRVYWAFYCHGARPWIVANGGLESKQRCAEDFISVPDSDNWMYYESSDEIQKLVGWLTDKNVREKELRESIVQLQINKLKDSEYTDKHILSGEPNHPLFSSGGRTLSADVLATRAMTALGKKFGPCPYRCDCLELLWPSRDHCPSCHQSFPTSEELRQHSKDNCKTVASVSKRSQISEDFTKTKKLRIFTSQEKHSGNVGILRASTSEKQNDGPHCPFKFEEITARFIVPNSIKEAANGIGLIGSGGVPSFLPSRSPYLSDRALALEPRSIKEVSVAQTRGGLGIHQHHSNENFKGLNRLSKSAENSSAEGGSTVERVKSIMMSERDRVSSLKEKSSLLGLTKSSIIRESSLRPLVGRASEVLRLLKINLLDMDAALPEEAIRLSRSNQDKRCAWRAFVKSARSIYEMVLATIVLEYAIKTEYLCNDWWYWSSPSTAAKTTTLAALSLRIYALDSAISYEKPLSSTATEIPEPDCRMDEDAVPQAPMPTNLTKPSSSPPQKTPEAEAPRTRSRTSKIKKDHHS